MDQRRRTEMSLNLSNYKKLIVSVTGTFGAVVPLVLADGQLSTQDVVALALAVLTNLGVFQLRNVDKTNPGIVDILNQANLTSESPDYPSESLLETIRPADSTHDQTDE